MAIHPLPARGSVVPGLNDYESHDCRSFLHTVSSASWSFQDAKGVVSSVISIREREVYHWWANSYPRHPRPFVFIDLLDPKFTNQAM